MADEQAWRQARREFIRTHHPDRGGDPAAFAAGLAAYERRSSGEPAPRVVIVADTPWLVSLLRPMLRRMGWRRPPSRIK
jgi:hypothetical protein